MRRLIAAIVLSLALASPASATLFVQGGTAAEVTTASISCPITTWGANHSIWIAATTVGANSLGTGACGAGICDGATNTLTYTPDPNTQPYASGTSVKTWVWYVKTTGAGGTITITVTFSGTNTHGMQCAEFQNQKTPDPLHNSTGQACASGLTCGAPSTTDTNGGIMFSSLGAVPNTTGLTVPASYTAIGTAKTHTWAAYHDTTGTSETPTWNWTTNSGVAVATAMSFDPVPVTSGSGLACTMMTPGCGEDPR